MKKDFLYLNEKYGECEDLCGDVCNTEMMIGLLLGTRSKSSCYEHIMNRYFTIGTEEGELDLEDNRTAKIKQRWTDEGLLE